MQGIYPLVLDQQSKYQGSEQIWEETKSGIRNQKEEHLQKQGEERQGEYHWLSIWHWWLELSCCPLWVSRILVLSSPSLCRQGHGVAEETSALHVFASYFASWHGGCCTSGGVLPFWAGWRWLPDYRARWWGIRTDSNIRGFPFLRRTAHRTLCEYRLYVYVYQCCVGELGLSFSSLIDLCMCLWGKQSLRSYSLRLDNEPLDHKVFTLHLVLHSDWTTGWFLVKRWQSILRLQHICINCGLREWGREKKLQVRPVRENECGECSDRSLCFDHSRVLLLVVRDGLWSVTCKLLSLRRGSSILVNEHHLFWCSIPVVLPPKICCPTLSTHLYYHISIPNNLPSLAEVPQQQRLRFQTGLRANGWMRSQSQCSGQLTQQTCQRTVLPPSHYMSFKQTCPHNFEG